MPKFSCGACRQVAIGSICPALCERCGNLDSYTESDDSYKTKKDRRSILASEYVPRSDTKIPTIEPNLNSMLWGGFNQPSTTVLWGKAGAGKSRCTIRWASNMGRTLYITNEMDRENSVRYAIDVGAKLENFHVLDDESCWEDEAREIKPLILIYDSISDSAFRMKVLLPRLAAWKDKNKGIVFCIAHRNKKGQVSGTTDAEHWPDYNLDFRPHQEDQVKIICPKSRYCPKGFCYIYLK